MASAKAILLPSQVSLYWQSNAASHEAVSQLFACSFTVSTTRTKASGRWWGGGFGMDVSVARFSTSGVAETGEV